MFANVATLVFLTGASVVLSAPAFGFIFAGGGALAYLLTARWMLGWEHSRRAYLLLRLHHLWSVPTTKNLHVQRTDEQRVS